MSRWRYLLWATPLLLAVLIAPVLLGRWLESEPGRQLLQRELEQALGQAVILRPGYGLQLIPGIGIGGSALAVGDPLNARALAAVGDFFVGLEWWPLLRGQLVISRVDLRDGFLDLAWQTNPAAATSDPLTLPTVRLLTLTDLELRWTGAPLLQLAELRSTGLAPGATAEIAASLRTVTPGNTAELSFQGSLGLSTELAAELQIASGTLNWPPLSLAGWTAQLDFLPGSRLAIEVRQPMNQGEFHANASLDLQQPGLFQLVADIRAAGKPGLGMELAARIQSESARIESLDLKLGDGQLAGLGCFAWQDGLRLDIMLGAEVLDLQPVMAWQNDVQAWWDGLSKPSSQQVESAPVEAPSPDTVLDLGLSVDIGTLRLGDTKAETSRLVIGRAPQCPDPVDAGQVSTPTSNSAKRAERSGERRYRILRSSVPLG